MQDPSDMSDPSEANQPQHVFVLQGPGRYFSVPWCFPVAQHPVYPNYPVDPNHPQQWIPAHLYGNAPILNGRQSETDGSEHESNVDDERSGGASYPPPGVGMPVSSMQQQPVYQMVPPFSNMYVGSIPSGVNVQGYVNSSIPYPHPFPGMAAGGELNTPPNSNRGGRGSGKAGAGGKVSGEKGGGNSGGSVNETFNSQPSLTSQDSNSSSDLSTPSLPPTLAPPHPPTNFMPMGPMQYGYPYFQQAGPPPAHITSAQHATGSPLYIPHPVYHPGPIYSSPPAAVFSTDNGMPPHSAVSVPVSMPPPSELSSNHESESSAFVAKEVSTEETYKNSNLMADSPPFEQDARKNGSGGNLAQENVSTSSDVSPENYSLPNNSDQSIPSEVLCSTDKDESGTDDHCHAHDHSISSSETASLEQPLNSTEKSIKSDTKVDSATIMLGDMSVQDEKASDKEPETTYVTKNGVTVMNYKNGMKLTANFDLSTVLGPNATNNVAESKGKVTETESKESKSGSSETVNGKCSTSQDASSGFDGASKTSSSTDIKPESIEEPPSAPETKTWASLFKESSSSSKPKPSAAAVAKQPIESGNNTPTYVHQSSDSHSNTTSSNTSSVNGMPMNQSQSKMPQYRNSPMSSSSIADDATLPKIGELLKNYKLDHRAVNFEPRGLENRSNYCYVNAILQALLGCPPFYNLMKCISHNVHNTKTRMASMHHFPIIDSMVQFVDEFKLISQKARRDKARKMDAIPHQEIIPGKPFEPSSMLSVIQGNSLFTVGQQEDAQEFLTCLLNGLNDEMVELIQLTEAPSNGINSRKTLPPASKTPPAKNNKKISNGDIASEVHGPDDSDSEWQQVHSKVKSNRPNNLALTRTPLSEIFRGQTRSRLQKIGDQTTNNIEPFFTLHLNIEKAASVKEALESLFGQSALEGVTSSKTNQEVDAWQQQTLEELPFVLLLHLKYFDYKHHACTKILKPTEFPIDLKLEIKLISSQSVLRSKQTGIKSRQYKLFAVVYHDGKEATKGHYITDVFHIGYGGWIRYDDAKVSTVSESDVLKPKLPRVPYLLYYRRCDTIAALMQPPFEKRM